MGRSGLVRELGHVRRCMIEHRVSICDGRGRPAACNVPRRRIALGGNGRRSRTAQHTHDAAENKLTHDAAGVPPFMSGDCTLKASPVPAMASATAADVERRAPMLGTASTQSRQLPFPAETRQVPNSKAPGIARGRRPRVPRKHIRRPQRTLTPVQHDTSALSFVVSRTRSGLGERSALRLLSLPAITSPD